MFLLVGDRVMFSSVDMKLELRRLIGFGVTGDLTDGEVKLLFIKEELSLVAFSWLSLSLKQNLHLVARHN